mmetsp:Transcript_39694/g.60830  ORF Transcript_39694/g.60830 Transcript_39694/m.60830 type:complete len:199 (+) Transcript_39694:317-913(+)
MRGKFFVMLPLVALFMGVALWNLGSTADSYLSPALEAISEKLSCSESLAGVTLLALGNGAPDVFASISAGGDGTKNGDIMLQVSSLAGSSLFITTVVMVFSLAAAKGKRIYVTKHFFLRDIAFLFAVNVYLLVVMIFFERVTFLLAIGFLIIYVVYVIFVVVQSKVHQPNEDVVMADETKRAVALQKMVEYKRQVHKD